MQKSNTFSAKIDCIYKNIANSDLTTLAALFLAPVKEDYKANIANRKAHISRKWLHQEKSDFTPRTFKSEYKEYNFYKEIRIENRPLFQDAFEFLELPLEEFCKRVYEYVSYKNSLYIDNENFTYNYLYIFKNSYASKDKNSIQEYQIHYGKKLSMNSMEITITPTDANEDESYSGIARYKDSKLILQFENEWNFITVICSLEFMNHKTQYLIGILSGFSEFNKKIPGAKKVILTRIKAFDTSRQYLTLNETELLYAEENSYKFNLSSYDYLKNHFQKYATKIDALDRLFTNLSKSGAFNECYYQLAFREIHTINRIFQNITKGASYYVKNRYNVLKALFSSFDTRKYQRLTIATPIYGNYFLFNHFSPEIEETMHALERLHSKGVRVEIVFIIMSCEREITPAFQKHLDRLEKIAKLYFVQNELIENKVASIDLLCVEDSSGKSDFVIYKPLQNFQQIFVLTKEYHLIEQLKTNYKTILHYAKEYQPPLKLEDYCIKHKGSIDALVGDWYLYVYGSKQLWEFKMTILGNNSVTLYYKGKVSDRGKIINNQYQSIILVEDAGNSTTTAYLFDNNLQELRHAFLVKVVAKQYKSYNDMFSIGICSKEPIAKKDIQYILGEQKEHIHFIDDAIKARLSDYVFKRFEMG